MGTPFLHRAAMLANRVAPFSATVLAHTTLLLVTGFLVYRLLRRQGAGVQSLVLKAFLVSVLVSPAIALLGSHSGIRHLTVRMPVEQPALPLVVPQAETGGGIGKLWARSSRAASHTVPLAPPADTIGGGPAAASTLTAAMRNVPVPTVAARKAPSTRSFIYLLVTAAWLAMSFCFLGRFGYGLIAGWVLTSRAERVDPMLQRAGDWLAARHGLSMPRLFRSDRIAVPFLTGIVRPIVMLPRNIRLTSDVMLHELCHFINGDCFWNMLSHAAMIAFPLQPLAHILSHELEDVSDFVCDDFVVSESADPRAYALELITYAEIAASCRGVPGGGAALVPGRSTLRRRVERIITASGAGEPRNVRYMILPVTAMCAALVSLAAFVGFEGRDTSRDDRSVQDGGFGHVLVLQRPDLHSLERDLAVMTGDGFPAGEYPPASESVSSRVLITAVPVSAASSADVILSDETPPINTRTFSDRVVPQYNSAAMIGWLAVGYQDIAAREADASPDVIEQEQVNVAPEPAAHAEEPADDTMQTAALMLVESAHASDGAMVRPIAEDIVPGVTAESDPASAQLVSTAMPETIPLDFSIFTNYDECMDAGLAFFEDEGYFNALKLFKRAAGFKPNDAEANYRIGRTYLRTHDYQNAKMFLQIAIAIDPGNPELHYCLGDIILRQGDLDGAREQYKLAYNINPAFVVSQEAVVY